MTWRLEIGLSGTLLETFVLGVTGYVAAWIGGANRPRAIARTVIGGALALAATYAVGSLFGTTIG